MKLLKTISYKGAFGLLALIALSTTSSPAETQTNFSDFFKLGEMYKAFNYSDYYIALDDKIDPRFKDMTELAKSLGAPQAVLDDIESVHRVNASLPWAKSGSDWTDDQKKLWRGASSCFGLDIWNKWLLVTPYDNAFFFYLGKYSLEAWYGVQAGISQRSETMSSLQDDIRVTSHGMQSLQTDSDYTHALSLLNLDAVAAIKTTSAIKNKVDDPLSSGVTMDDVNALGNAGKTLHDLNTQGKLLK
jgi:hypothetical protein